jgi:hypothetical protein
LTVAKSLEPELETVAVLTVPIESSEQLLGKLLDCSELPLLSEDNDDDIDLVKLLKEGLLAFSQLC